LLFHRNCPIEIRAMIRLHNTLTDRKEELVPLRDREVGLYVCGITVYDFMHVGHARFLVAFDAITRFLRWDGWRVRYVRNWTDVDDKIIRRGNERGVDPLQLSQEFIEACRVDMAALNVLPADVEPKATEHIAEMHAIIARLIEQGHAYAVDGDVYFAVRSYPEYGKLSKRNVDDLRAGARVDPGDRKRDPLDFALWKAAKPGEPASVTWDSPWGKGRPGWHIECSAMCQKHLGTTFDLHGGGKDLVFPHHENEIAQSEAASGQPLSRYWLHNGFVTLNAEKMSKSTGNFFTVRDVLQSWDGESLRMWLLGTQYRNPINYTLETLAEADKRVEALYEALLKAQRWLAQKKHAAPGEALKESREAFRAAMEDDFNTAEAMAVILGVVNQLNARIDGKAPPAEVASLFATARELLGALGLCLREPAEAVPARRQLAARRCGVDCAWVEERIQARLQARKGKDYAKADAIRAEVAAKRVELRDTPQGTDWRVLL
jgi:cysteinyl-tRNA synthetase